MIASPKKYKIGRGRIIGLSVEALLRNKPWGMTKLGWRINRKTFFSQAVTNAKLIVLEYVQVVHMMDYTNF
jgi:hypothetical protein